jgi:hypothetical protein
MIQKRLQWKPSVLTNTHPILRASNSGWVTALKRAAGQKPTMTLRPKRHPLITWTGRLKGIREKLILQNRVIQMVDNQFTWNERFHHILCDVVVGYC